MATLFYFFFFFNDTATTEIYTLSLHDALPILEAVGDDGAEGDAGSARPLDEIEGDLRLGAKARILRASCEARGQRVGRSEEHTSELQSRQYLVCRLLLEKKKKKLIRLLCYLHI